MSCVEEYAKKQKEYSKTKSNSNNKTTKAEVHSIVKNVLKSIKKKAKKESDRVEEELNAIGSISLSDFDKSNVSSDSDASSI